MTTQQTIDTILGLTNPNLFTTLSVCAGMVPLTFVGGFLGVQQRMYSSCDPPVHTAYNRNMNLTCACPSTHQEEESTLNSGESPADREHSSPEISQSVILATLHSVARQAVRTAAELMAPETARELKAARRKLGLASLTISERKAKTDVRFSSTDRCRWDGGYAVGMVCRSLGYRENSIPLL